MWSAAERRFTRHVCLRHPFRPFHFGFPSIHSLPEAGSREQQYPPPVLHSAWIMPIPSFQLQKNASLMHRSRGFGHGVVASTISYNAVIVLSVVLCDCCKPTSNCRDWAFSNSGLEVGLPAFQLPMFAKPDTAERRFARHVCLRHPFRPFHFGIPSIHSLPEARGCWERQYAPPALDYACINLAKDPIPLSKIPDLCLM